MRRTGHTHILYTKDNLDIQKLLAVKQKSTDLFKFVKKLDGAVQLRTDPLPIIVKKKKKEQGPSGTNHGLGVNLNINGPKIFQL